MDMEIDARHQLTGARRIGLGEPGAAISPRLIVVHYTGGSTLRSAVETLRSSGLSYHVLIDLDGSCHQARSFDRAAAHAGRSNWKAMGGLVNASSLNASSIGISLVNLGAFRHFAQGRWFWGWREGAGYGPSIADAEAEKHTLIYEPGRPVHWTPYRPAQIAACGALIAALVDRYASIEEIVGHHDIAIGAKSDPGPLVPLERWRRQFGRQGGLGFEARVSSPDGFLNLRNRPDASSAVIRSLRNGDTVHIRSVTYSSPFRGLVRGGGGRALTAWASVDRDGSNTHAGFVHMRYLTGNPLAPAYATRLQGR